VILKKNIKENNQIIRLAIISLTVLFIFYVYRVLLFSVTTLPFEAYYENSIQLGFFEKIAENFLYTLPLIIGIIVLRKRLLIQWGTFEKGIFFRNFIIFICVILTWMFAFYDYNYFFNQSHLIDRLFILVLIPLIFWRPIFVFLFIIQVFLIIGQFEVLHGFSLAFPLYPLFILILFASLFTFKLLGGNFKFIHFVYLLGCLIATQYLFSGIGKLIKEGWLMDDQIAYILPSAYSNGWLSFMGDESISVITKSLSYFNIPLKFLAIFLEVGILFFFWKRSWTRMLLFAIVVFHIGIFVFSGIFFWAWILIDILFAILILRKKFFEEKLIFNRKAFLLSLFLIVSGNYWCRPPKLAWLDAPLNYVHQLYAVTDEGRTIFLPPDFFRPYDYQFTLTTMNYLDKKPRINVTAGVTSFKNTFDFFKTNRSDKEIFEHEKTNGNVKYNEKKKKNFTHFIQTFISNRNHLDTSQKRHLSYLRPPDLLWTYTPFIGNQHESLNFNGSITKVYVITKTTYYDMNKGYREIRKDTIQEICIPK
jgi:hypothetical protein